MNVTSSVSTRMNTISNSIGGNTGVGVRVLTSIVSVGSSSITSSVASISSVASARMCWYC